MQENCQSGSEGGAKYTFVPTLSQPGVSTPGTSNERGPPCSYRGVRSAVVTRSKIIWYLRFFRGAYGARRHDWEIPGVKAPYLYSEVFDLKPTSGLYLKNSAHLSNFLTQRTVSAVRAASYALFSSETFSLLPFIPSLPLLKFSVFSSCR
jgi:hypothetical protein